jgi:hypothetical protein
MSEGNGVHSSIEWINMPPITFLASLLNATFEVGQVKVGLVDFL